MDIGPPEIIILAVIVLVIFGGSKIPQFAKNLGKAKSEFEKGIKEGQSGDKGDKGDKPADKPAGKVAEMPAPPAVDAVPIPPAIDVPSVEVPSGEAVQAPADQQTS